MCSKLQTWNGICVGEEVGVLGACLRGPKLSCVDFNVTRSPFEKRNCRSPAMEEFFDFIKDWICWSQLEGGCFTWVKGDNSRIASKIDRILISQEWDDRFNNLKHAVMQRLVCVITVLSSLQYGIWEFNKSYFKFDNWWLNTEGSVERVRDCRILLSSQASLIIF